MALPASLDMNEAEPQLATTWRERLLRQLGWVIYPLVAAVGLVSTLGARTELLRWYGLLILTVAVALLWIMSRERWYSFRLQGWLTIAAFMVLSAMGYSVVGYNPGPVLAAALSITLAALFFGNRAMVLVLAFFVLVTLIMTLLVNSGAWSGPSALERDYGNFAVWLRTDIVSVVLWLGIAYSATFVVRTVESELIRGQGALVRLREEQTHREAAEADRQRALEAAFQAQKMDSIGRLAAGVAHDFNNALLVIDGWTEALRESPDTEERGEAIDAISQASGHAAQLAHQLLTFGQKGVHAPSPLALGEVAAETASAVQRLMPSGVNLCVSVDPRPRVLADANQVQQMVLNLLMNARDALPDGGEIALTVRPDAQPPGNLSEPPAAPFGWVELRVVDNGVGMNPEVQGHIFEPFFTTKNTESGTGLGLASVMGIVEQNDAHLQVESRKGDGSRFSVWFRALEDGARSSESEQPAEDPAPKEKRDPGAAPRILVVEDDALARDLLVRALTAAGYDITYAEDGDQALSSIESAERPFDLLCSDAVFPGAPLDDVIAEFEIQSPEAPVVICSGYVPEDLAIEGLTSGRHTFLPKPFPPSRLIETIRGELG